MSAAAKEGVAVAVTVVVTVSVSVALPDIDAELGAVSTSSTSLAVTVSGTKTRVTFCGVSREVRVPESSESLTSSSLTVLASAVPLPVVPLLWLVYHIGWIVPLP